MRLNIRREYWRDQTIRVVLYWLSAAKFTIWRKFRTDDIPPFEKFKIVPRLPIGVATLLLFLNCSIGSAAEIEWKPEASWKQNENKSISGLIQQAEFFEKYNNYKKAIKYYKKIEKLSVNLSNKGKAIVAHGISLENMNEPWRAYLQYKKAVDNYSNYISFVDILEREFKIANIFYEGKKDKVLFFKFSTRGKAVEIYDHIAKAGPYAEITPQAIYRSGLLSLKSKNFEEAAVKFNDLINRYSRNKLVGDTRIELADCLLKHAADGDGDGSRVRQAHKQLSIFFTEYPRHSRADEADALLQSALESESERMLYLGEFYLRENSRRIDASKRYLQKVVDDYGKTENARLAEKLLAIIDER